MIIRCTLTPLISVLQNLYVPQLHARITSKMRHDTNEPKYRVPGPMIGSFLLAVGLFWFAWAAQVEIHWIVPGIVTIPLRAATSWSFAQKPSYLIVTCGALMRASALAANGLLRHMLRSVFPLFTLEMYRRPRYQLDDYSLQFVTVYLLPISWVFFWFGGRVRDKTVYL